MASTGHLDSGFLKKDELFQCFTDTVYMVHWENLGDGEIRHLRIRCAALLDQDIW